MPPTATLGDYIGASTVRNVEGEKDTYKLDGTKYIVPDTVLAAAETLQSGEGIRGRNLSSDPTPSDLGASRELLASTPETIVVTGGSGQAKAGQEWRVAERSTAESMAQQLRDAEQTASQHYPQYWEEKFGADYSVDVIGPGLYADEMFDGVTVPEPPSKFGPQASFKRHLPSLQVETIRVVSEFGDSTGLSVGDGVLVFRESGLSNPLTLANDVADAYEQALSNLKNQYPDNWQEWYGYTTVPVIDER